MGCRQDAFEEEQQRLSREGLTRQANGTVVKFLQTPPGEPFRQTFARRVCAVVFGTPHSRRINIIHASKSLSALCAASLKEDDYGQVASQSIALVIKTYTTTILEVEQFVAGSKPSWTDVDFREGSERFGVRGDRRVEAVEVVLGVLRAGLEEVLLAFGEYAGAVGVGRKELREAREAVARGLGVEMRQVQ